ncbi:MAG: glutathione S-transferase N-terminal domain-containing protein [Verrucomicrobia bacterium]|nr:glutathione S-transferase N-terminal domain-containing protein [Verrucomicrobiota bacterium]MBI3866928.1 glutathione S-transferase N-terminal domain-containing protein [Verrucomicrobiota bacterium]
MIELYQFPWSPYCLVQRRILEYSGAPFRVVNIPNGDRARIWKLTRRRYYQVPVVRAGKSIVFETGDNSQVIAKYLDDLLGLGLFPKHWRGLQDLLWPVIENDVEGVAFKLNDIYWREFVPPSDQLRFLRHKERKFGRGCLDRWRQDRASLLAQLAGALAPFEQMVSQRPYLLEETPRFVDFDLYGMLANFLYSGRYRLPPTLKNLRLWYRRVERARHPSLPN